MSRDSLKKLKSEFSEMAGAFFKNMEIESDRGAILVTASVLEVLLEKQLRLKFSSDPNVIRESIDPLFKRGPLNSFMSKIHILRALKIINEEIYSDLEIIRKLRNNVAHYYGDVNFNSQNIVKLIKKLKCEEIDINRIPTSDGMSIPYVFSKESPNKSNSSINKNRARFLSSVSFIANVLINQLVSFAEGYEYEALKILTILKKLESENELSKREKIVEELINEYRDAMNDLKDSEGSKKVIETFKSFIHITSNEQ